ncbi:uncharacterized protein BXZ73DRAFT_47105 [Epithele typhae]|uniref:uncharacterized protein n=1 Tax=Epithele typhae TaxID=378194 RepID=UPI0020079E21|nr:uncharacterized protein BXZ73DRAFT_47105 [Epithele typhae]KAH9931663.1 hypothetical protein BXZ73DRAFT_47105 [Epithele typhae]
MALPEKSPQIVSTIPFSFSDVHSSSDSKFPLEAGGPARPRNAAPTTIPITSSFTEHEIFQAWEKCGSTVQDHCDQMVKRWKEEIDMFLVFAGLFSAVLTAFNVHSLTISGTSTTFSAPKFDPSNSPAPRYAIWINTVWFSSLICTLSASSIAIMVKQWLQQYEQRLSGNSRDIARLRQYRYESLLKWRVVEIIWILPVLLQLSLFLFLAGLLILLWNLHHVVAGVATFLVSLLVVFSSTTTVIPTFKANCFYQSPQAFGVLLTFQALRKLFRRGGHDVFRDWNAREKAEVNLARDDLDCGLAIKTYEITLDEGMLKSAVIPCMWDISTDQLSSLVENILRTSNRFEPVIPCILHFFILASRDPEPNRRMVSKLLKGSFWPRFEANSELGELFLRAMATLVSRNFERELAFYRMTCSLSFYPLDLSLRVNQDTIDHILTVLPRPENGTQFTALTRPGPDDLPLAYAYLLAVPRLVRFLAQLPVGADPHAQVRVHMHIDAVFHALQCFLLHASLSENVAALATTLWALRAARHLEQVVALKTDARCSPLVPPDLVELYADALDAIQSAVQRSGTGFAAYFGRHRPGLVGGGPRGLRVEPAGLVESLRSDLGVLRRLFFMVPWQLGARRAATSACLPVAPRVGTELMSYRIFQCAGCRIAIPHAYSGPSVVSRRRQWCVWEGAFSQSTR